ncbi:hypothetical protein GN958_ATG04240 [Phytophthora infestans]|uniref:Uncharacterized protein n=1 Tax=Phytophthora infestans TaxID=4787 RepID=A0A8S9UZK3_PHYIN|nr:hypothetical protein GN958_ATG04240 [Phytophthora infestans]
MMLLALLSTCLANLNDMTGTADLNIIYEIYLHRTSHHLLAAYISAERVPIRNDLVADADPSRGDNSGKARRPKVQAGTASASPSRDGASPQAAFLLTPFLGSPPPPALRALLHGSSGGRTETHISVALGAQHSPHQQSFYLVVHDAAAFVCSGHHHVVKAEGHTGEHVRVRCRVRVRRTGFG